MIAHGGATPTARPGVQVALGPPHTFRDVLGFANPGRAA